MKIKDFKADGYGLNFSELPKTRQEAREKNNRYFFSNTKCVNGHLAPKYTSGGRCVFCSVKDSASRRGKYIDGPSKKMLSNLVRSQAIKAQNKKYIPAFECKHGHKLRYTGSNNCVECFLKSAEKRKEKARERRLLKIYGIDFKNLELMLSSQNHKCKICLTELTQKNMHVDHCHSTNKVRGVLCSKCNQAIGLLKENKENFLRALEYLQCN